MQLLLRRLRGAYSRIAHLGFSGCGRCWRRWKIAEAHMTRYNRMRSCFPLCEECWNELTPETRLPYYRSLWRDWLDEDPTMQYYGEHNWPEIERAVMQGK